MRAWPGPVLAVGGILAGRPALAQPPPGQGEAIYDQACSGCHGAVGEGGAGPALRSNHMLANRQFVLQTMLRGQLMMPSFAGRLSNDQIAAVTTYVRNSWGNRFGPITSDDVAAARPHPKPPASIDR